MKLNPSLKCEDLRKNTKVCVSSEEAGNGKRPNFDHSKEITLH